MNTSKLAPHETLGIHEMLSAQVIGIKKLSASIGMVQDSDLKALMSEALEAKKTALKQIESTISSQM